MGVRCKTITRVTTTAGAATPSPKGIDSYPLVSRVRCDDRPALALEPEAIAPAKLPGYRFPQ